jgi:hypothetical protein
MKLSFLELDAKNYFSLKKFDKLAMGEQKVMHDALAM